MADAHANSLISDQVRSIAEAAIKSINEITSLVENGPRTVSCTPRTNNMPPLSTPRSTISQTLGTSSRPLINQVAAVNVQTRQTNALTELRRRFPTVASRARECSGRYVSNNSRSSHPYSSTAPRRRVGRPTTNDVVAKDVIILDAGQDKLPTKSEKVDLEKDGRIISGFDIDRKWNSTDLQLHLASLLTGELIGLSFEIVKNCSGTIVRPNIPLGKEIDAKLLLKSIAPGGYVYIRLLEKLETSINSYDVENEIPVESTSEIDDTDDNLIATLDLSETNTNLSPSDAVDDKSKDNCASSFIITSTENTQQDVKCPFDINSIIVSVKEQDLSNPVEVLRFLQQEIVSGRALDLFSLEETIEGETNYITVDRDKIVETTFSELQYMNDYRPTFQIDFMGEESVDFGGPRKEWIRLMNHAIKEKYFEHGLRTLLAPDYFFVGVMIAVAILQNGQLPAFLSDEILSDLLSSRNCSNPCIYQIQRGLEMLGMLSALMQLPVLVYLLQPGVQPKVTVQKLLLILKPKFSEEGSNALALEKETYQMFVRYVREVAASRRVCGQLTLNLGHILQFVTCASEEPVLGFFHTPAIKFIFPKEMTTRNSEEAEQKGASFLPTAHTCSNILELPRGTREYPLPSVDTLFKFYDLAFSQSYFGKQ